MLNFNSNATALGNWYALISTLLWSGSTFPFSIFVSHIWQSRYWIAFWMRRLSPSSGLHLSVYALENVCVRVLPSQSVSGSNGIQENKLACNCSERNASKRLTTVYWPFNQVYKSFNATVNYYHYWVYTCCRRTLKLEQKFSLLSTCSRSPWCLLVSQYFLQSVHLLVLLYVNLRITLTWAQNPQYGD